MKRTRPAFTLIELLIVVAIIAILAAIAVPNFLEAQVRSKVSRVKADMRTVATALESYVVDNNVYPPAWEAFTTGAVWGTFNTPPFHSRVPSLVTTPVAYLTSLPEDPFRAVEPTALGTGFLGQFSKRFVYYNFRYNFVNVAPPPAQNTFAIASTIAGPWLLYSVGPDRDEWNRPDGLTGGLVAIRVYRDYDPTNGTISLGNIFRTPANGDHLGVHPYFWTSP